MISQTDSRIRQWTVEEIAAALRRRSRILIVAFVALSLGIVAAVATAPSLYEGHMKLLVKRDRADSVISGAPDAAAAQRDLEISETEVMSQVELLRSPELIEQVAAETGLVRRVRAEDPSLSEEQVLDRAAKALAERLNVAPVKRTFLIDVKFEGDDRRLTRNVLDTLSRLYLEKYLALQRPAGSYEFFADQAQRAKQELDALRLQLTAYGREHQVVSADLEKQAVLQKLNEFDAMRAEAAAQLAEAQRRLATVGSELARAPERRTTMVRSDPRVITDVRARIVTLEMKRAELLQKFTPEYRGIVEIDAQLREARAALEAAERTPVHEQTVTDNPTRQWLDTELARTRAEEAAMAARVSALASTVGQYRSRAQALDLRDAEQQMLEREIEAAEAKYLLYAQKQEEARISDELDRTRIANVVVAEGPSVALVPRREPSLAWLPLLIAGAFLLSAGLAIVVDLLGPAFAVAPTNEVAAQIWASRMLSREQKHQAVRGVYGEMWPTT